MHNILKNMLIYYAYYGTYCRVIMLFAKSFIATNQINIYIVRDSFYLHFTRWRAAIDSMSTAEKPIQMTES